jgi:hypothetical protein
MVIVRGILVVIIYTLGMHYQCQDFYQKDMILSVHCALKLNDYVQREEQAKPQGNINELYLRRLFALIQ